MTDQTEDDDSGNESGEWDEQTYFVGNWPCPTLRALAEGYGSEATP